MATERRMRFVRGQVGWMLGLLVLLTLVGAFSLDLFVALSVIGLVILTELTAPFGVTPVWQGRVRILLVVSLVLFLAVISRRFIHILPPELIP